MVKSKLQCPHGKRIFEIQLEYLKCLILYSFAGGSISKVKLIDLNFDCLAEIFKNLSINDLYAIARACPAFEMTFKLFNKKSSIATNNFTTSHFLRTIGMQIECIKLNEFHGRAPCTSNEMLRTVQTNCIHLKELKIKKWSHLTLDQYQMLLNRLKMLHLIECDILRRFNLNRSTIAAENLNWLRELPNLTTLKLYKCNGFGPMDLLEFLQHNNNQLIELLMFQLKDFQTNQMNDEFFDNLTPYLQSLECITVDVDTMCHIQFIANLKKLRRLHLFNYTQYNGRMVDRLMQTICQSTTLEELDLYFCNLSQNTYRFISQIPNLHMLKLQKNYWLKNEHLEMLHLMRSLKVLSCFDNIHLSDMGLLLLVKMAPKLSHLDISWCYMIENAAVLEILALLNEQTHRPKLNIVAGGRTKITKTIFDVSSF